MNSVPTPFMAAYMVSNPGQDPQVAWNALPDSEKILWLQAALRFATRLQAGPTPQSPKSKPKKPASPKAARGKAGKSGKKPLSPKSPKGPKARRKAASPKGKKSAEPHPLRHLARWAKDRLATFQLSDEMLGEFMEEYYDEDFIAAIYPIFAVARAVLVFNGKPVPKWLSSFVDAEEGMVGWGDLQMAVNNGDDKDWYRFFTATTKEGEYRIFNTVHRERLSKILDPVAAGVSSTELDQPVARSIEAILAHQGSPLDRAMLAHAAFAVRDAGTKTGECYLRSEIPTFERSDFPALV